MTGQGNGAISSRRNPVYLELRRLSASRRERRKRGMCLLEGERLVRAAVLAAASLRTLVFTPSARESDSASAIIDLCPGARTVLIRESLFNDLSSLASPDGIMAVMPIPALTEPLPPGDLLLVDGVQDPGNLGMIIRSAAIAGTGAVLLSAESADPWSPKVLRAGMGAHFRLAVGHGLSLAGEAERFPGEVLVLHHRGEQSLYEVDLTASPLALVVGAEGRGVSADLAVKADRKIAIPMPGWDEPLNAAAAVTVCLFEMVRQRGEGGRRR